MMRQAAGPFKAMADLRVSLRTECGCRPVGPPSVAAESAKASIEKT